MKPDKRDILPLFIILLIGITVMLVFNYTINRKVNSQLKETVENRHNKVIPQKNYVEAVKRIKDSLEFEYDKRTEEKLDKDAIAKLKNDSVKKSKVALKTYINKENEIKAILEDEGKAKQEINARKLELKDSIHKLEDELKKEKKIEKTRLQAAEYDAKRKQDSIIILKQQVLSKLAKFLAIIQEGNKLVVVREKPNNKKKTKIIDNLKGGIKCEVIDKSLTTDTLKLDNNKLAIDYWYRIITPKNKSGWIFGYYTSERLDLLKR